MAGAQQLEAAEREAEKSKMAKQKAQNRLLWQWKVQFGRCFTFPTSYLSKTSSTTTTSPSLLSSMKRSQFKPIWISSSGLSTVSLHPSVDVSSSADSILTVSLEGTVIEEHFISKLQFVWPQVSCLSGFPTRGSVVIIASYVDSSNEKQKFGLRFSEVSEAEEFITSLEAILLNKIATGSPAVDALSAISSESEAVPPYRPDISSVSTPICAPTSLNILNKEDKKDSQTQDMFADSQCNNVGAFPPRFTSLVSSCAADVEQGQLALALAAGDQNVDLKAQIAKYMQDASFLDMVNKVNEVITELGGDYAI